LDHETQEETKTTKNTMKTPEEDGKLAIEKIVSSKRTVKSDRILACVEHMREDIHHGKAWKVGALAEQLMLQPNTIQFGLAMSEVNRMLEREGYHLTTRGKHGAEYFAESIERSPAIGAAMVKDGLNLFKRAVVFLHGVSSNHGDKLTETQRRKIEKQAEVAALRYVLAKRIR